MDTIRYTGDPADVARKFADLPRYLAGELPDATGAIRDALTAVGLSVLANVHEHFRLLSEGGRGHDGSVWEELSAVTLALRRKEYTPAAIARLTNEFAKGVPWEVPKHRRRLLQRQAKALREFYTSPGAPARAKRRRALRLLELMRPHISKTRYNKTKSEIEKLRNWADPKGKLRRVVFAGAAALILRDEGALFNSLEPHIGAADQHFAAGPGWVEVGTTLSYAKYHQSPEPRRLRADGRPVLPRRPIFPDAVPKKWLDDAREALRRVISTRAWVVKFLGGDAR
jgi:hypothetical protein